ncbi:MAG: membrane-bound PQQ-dependent dehydrogenase, glucose/quinate/shikimate family [Novosphingobium sp.]|nr:membrane-bound PQQ-dependent dehydrogenase, glucose/quinate/shikimate family [Novosphingobium sp.]
MKAAALVGRIVFGLVLAGIGLALAWGGVRLIGLGGSFYYLPAGLAALASGALVLTGRWRLGAAVYLVLFLVTLVWALIEAGLNGWALMPRVLSPFILGLPFVIAAAFGQWRGDRYLALGASGLVFLLFAGVWATSGYTPAQGDTAAPLQASGDAPGDWPQFGNTPEGTFFSPLTDINRNTVGQLKVAWQIPLGPMPVMPIGQNQTVPLKVGDQLYFCNAFSDVFAADAETGKIRWEYRPKPDVSGLYTTKCRGVSYYEVPEASGTCAARIYTARTDGKLVALDSRTGTACADFGEDGTVDLLKGIEQRNTGYYRVTSAPTVVRGKLVIGGAVADGQHVREPSGVVRAYDAVTGELAWAWDIDNPDNARGPAEGGSYTSGTPNVWGPMSADEELGMVYAPTGNATPDYWAGHRSEQSHVYGSSVVALDAETGEPRWHFQTVHYDVWDYDIASQPVLFELRKPGAEPVPALIQPTKRGQLFVLDRRTGEPLFPIEEKPAPQEGGVEKLSPTQPWSTGMPNLGGPLLSESKMWGLSALDQMWCRIAFRESRYDGEFTPPGATYSITDPGYTGGVNWGSAAIDTDRQLAFLLSNRLVTRVRLVPRADPSARDLKANSASNLGGLVPQEGTPYAADVGFFMSPLGVPCQQPPHGLINAVDLSTGKLVWSRPLGTARDTGPMRIPSGLPITIGTMTFGGTMTTAGGLVFAGGSLDHAFRAFDSETGKLLFEADLPGSAATRPMTFRSDKDGRQYVVVASDAPYKDGKAYAAITAFALEK